MTTEKKIDPSTFLTQRVTLTNHTRYLDQSGNRGYPTARVEERTGVYRQSNGSIWSVANALATGLVLKDGDEADMIWCEETRLPSAAAIAAGFLDKEGAEYVLAHENTRRPRKPVHVEMNAPAAPYEAPFDASTPQGRFVASLITFLAGDMDDASKNKLAAAFRRAVRESAGISR